MLAVVTGAGVRVGRAIALALADAGYDLALCVSSSNGEAVAAEARAKGVSASVFTADLETDVDSLGSQLRSAYGSVDVLVNNAAIFDHVPFERVSRAAYRRMQAINLDAPFFLTQALLPSLRATRGSVVNIVDIASERALPGYAHYMVAKAGLAGLTRSLAVELAPDVRVNGVSPGIAAFPASWDEATRSRVMERIPLKRSGTPEDIARAVVYLARDGGYVTGQVLAVDGGWSAML